MLRLLLGLAVLGLALYVMLPKPGAAPEDRADPAAAAVQPMLKSLQDGGCQAAAGAANGGSLEQLQAAIEKCQRPALPRAGDAAGE